MHLRKLSCPTGDAPPDLAEALMAGKKLPSALIAEEDSGSLLRSLRELIHSARQRALQAVDAHQVQTCWDIGGTSSSSSREEQGELSTVGVWSQG